MRVNINLNEELLSFIDKQAERLHISRSAYISLCCTSKLNTYTLQQELINKHRYGSR